MQKNRVGILAFLGAVTLFAFPPFNQVYLLFLIYFVLFKSMYETTSAKETLYYGLAFGVPYFFIGLYWLFSVLKEYSFSSQIVMVVVLSLAILFYVLHYAIAGYIAWRLKAKVPLWLWSMGLLPLLFTMIEVARTWFSVGFPWFWVADALFGLGFEILLPYIGSLGVGFVFYTLIGGTLYLWLKRSRYLLSVMLGIGFLIVLLIYFIKDIVYTVPIKEPLNVQLLQTHFSKKDKDQRYKVVKRMKHYQSLSLEDRSIDLSVYPESAVSVSHQEVVRHLKKGFKRLKAQETEVLYGAYTYTNAQEISNVLIQGSSAEVVYAKQYLVPFGEYTPWFLGFLQSILPEFYMGDISRVSTPLTVKIKETILAPSICYEILFSNGLRRSMGEAEILLHISDLGWFDHTVAASYLLRVAQLRAKEAQKPLIYVVNAGRSAFISYQGEIVAKAPQREEVSSLTWQVQGRQGETFYIRYGNILLYILGIVIVGLMLYYYFDRKRERECLNGVSQL